MQIELDIFLTWVRTRHPDKVFNWNDPEACAAYQYLNLRTSETIDIYVEYYFVGKTSYDFPPVLARVYRAISNENPSLLKGIPMTFGNLGDRIDAEILATNNNNNKES